jgi:hypothetical protein
LAPVPAIKFVWWDLPPSSLGEDTSLVTSVTRLCVTPSIYP